jgi:AcrR family transcriptional regulator
MRQSNRGKILDAAVAVVQRDGVTGVTLDSVAAEAGLTRGGLMYHFRGRDALLLAIHRHLAGQWEAGMVEAAGKPAPDASAEERLAAYARVTTQSARRAELSLIIEAATHPDYTEPWMDVLSRWTPSVDEAASDPAALTRFVAHLAADGLWMYESLTGKQLPPELRRQVAEHIGRTIESGSPQIDEPLS